MQKQELASADGSSAITSHSVAQRWTRLTEDEHSRSILLLLTFLVIAVHVGIWSWLTQTVETETQAQPLVMQVSMIAMSSPKPVVAAPKPAPTTPPPPEKKPVPPKTPPKPVVKKPPPITQPAPDFAPSKLVSGPEPVPPVSGPSSPVNNTAATVNESKPAPVAPADSFTEANFRANYAQNPKPDYPPVAKSRGWSGKVLLKVQVSAQGNSDAVAIEQSSGHEILDESAVEAVKKWRFIPAKRGETPVASSVIVPIVFTLRN